MILKSKNITFNNQIHKNFPLLYLFHFYALWKSKKIRDVFYHFQGCKEMPCDNDLIPPLLPNFGWGRYLNKTFKEEEIQVFLNNKSNYLLSSALFQPSEFFFLIDKNLAIITCLSRSSRPWVFCKKSVLWNLAKLSGRPSVFLWILQHF